MALQAVFFLLFFVVGSLMALHKGPFWGLLTYVHVYFNIPSHQYWGSQVPDLRWSLISACILLVSTLMHRNDISPIPVGKSLGFKLLVGYLFMVILSSFWAPFPEDAKRGIYEFFRYVVIFYLIAKVVNTRERYQWLIILITAEVFNISLLAAARYRGGRLDTVGTVDASSSNQFAGLLAISLFLLIPLIVYGGKKTRLAVLVMAPFIANAFMMCGSRGGFVALAAGAIPFVMLLWNFAKGRWKRWKLAVGLIIVVLLGIRLMDSGFTERLLALVSLPASDSLVYEEISSGRTEIWRNGMNMVRDYPFGAGAKSFVNLSSEYLDDSLFQQGLNIRASHNTYLLALVEQGVPGLILCILFYFWILRLAGSVRVQFVGIEKSLPGEERKKIQGMIMHCYALSGAVISLMVHSVFADRLYFEMFYWLGAFSLCLVTIYHQEKAILQKRVEE